MSNESREIYRQDALAAMHVRALVAHRAEVAETQRKRADRIAKNTKSQELKLSNPELNRKQRKKLARGYVEKENNEQA